MKFLFLTLLLTPLVELYFLIKIGSEIGVGITILLVLLTALLGTALVRAQGFSILTRVQAQTAQGHPIGFEVLEGLLLFIAGGLLLTPGFFTDAIGFLLLTPPLRRRLIHEVVKRGTFNSRVYRGETSSESSHQQRGRIIDGEYKNEDSKP